MREIELKFKVKDKEILLKKLKSLNCEISEPLYQNDSIYVSDLESTESVEGSIWLRVRKENEKIELNLKKQSKKLEESKEIEFEVNSYEKANKFLETLGFVSGCVVIVVSEIGGNLIVHIKDSRIAIGKEMANKILI